MTTTTSNTETVNPVTPADLMEETRLHAVRVVELETERRTVRAYFGVSEATA